MLAGFPSKDFTPEKKTVARGAKKTGGRGKKKVSLCFTVEVLLIAENGGSFSSSCLFMCRFTESLLRLRLGVRVRKESDGQRLRGREASASPVRLRVSVGLQV